MIKASDSVDVIGTNSDGIQSIISAQASGDFVDNPGNAGTLTIETQRLTVQGGAQISTAGRKTGNGGNLTINATDSILLSGASPFATGESLDTGRSGLFVSAEPEATGNVGRLNLTTGLLTVENGARISADNFGSGLPGSSTLDVRQLIIQNGGEVKSGSFVGVGDGGTLTVNATESVDVVGTGTIAGNTLPSTLFSEASGAGKAGNLIINTPNLNVRDGGRVSVSATGTGAAGDLTANVNTIRLNRGEITAKTNAGEGGNIKLQNLSLLQMQNQSRISAEALNDANGGNIAIDADNGFVVAFPGQNNDIVASAERGRGGNININATSIFGFEERQSTPANTTNDIDASSEFGSQGSVNINTPDVEPNLTLPELSTALVDTSLLVDTGCAAFANSEGSSFTITGRGGLPPNPYEPLSPDVVWSDTRIPNITAQRNQVTTPPPSDSHVGAIVPATGWVFNGKGQVTLISHASRAPGLGSTPAKCPKR